MSITSGLYAKLGLDIISNAELDDDVLAHYMSSYSASSAVTVYFQHLDDRAMDVKFQNGNVYMAYTPDARVQLPEPKYCFYTYQVDRICLGLHDWLKTR